MVPDGEGGTSLSYKAPFLTYNSTKSARGEAIHYKKGETGNGA